MPLFAFLALFLSFTTYSSAQYCLCKPGSQAPDPYQKVINYACGNGADCGPIQPGGPCYEANEVRAICSYAANSYYQNKKSIGATCDFGGVAAPANALPSDVPSGCTYPTSAGSGPVSNGTTLPSPPGGVPISPLGSLPISPPGSFPTSPPGGVPISPLGSFPISPPGSFPTSPPGGGNTGTGSTPGIFSPIGLGPSGSMSDPGLGGATPLLQFPTFIVSLSLTFFAGLPILWG